MEGATLNEIKFTDDNRIWKMQTEERGIVERLVSQSAN